MNTNSWIHLSGEDHRHALPESLRARDPMAARDCGWVEQMLPFVESHASQGAWIIDPFCGFGSTLVAAALRGVRAAGVDLNAQRSEITRERLEMLGIDRSHSPVVTGTVTDATVRARLRQPDPGEPPRRFSLCLTNIPYFGCTEELQSPRGAHSEQLYSQAYYGPYLETLRKVFAGIHDLLEPEGWCVVMAQNLRLGGTVVPLAWDAARLLSERFAMHDERLMIYDRPGVADATSHLPTNRAHEYALVFRKHVGGMSLPEGTLLLDEMTHEGFAFAVFGSFAKWLIGGAPVAPADIDLLCPPDDAMVSRWIQWLEGKGFLITSWNTPVRPPIALRALAHRYYFRAKRLHRDGASLQVDLTIAESQAAYEAHLASGQAVMPGLPYPVLRDS